MTGQQGTILIVDDEAAIRSLLNKKLSGVGYQCQEAGNANQAMDELSKNAFDLVILDISMPGKSGVELLPEIKAVYPDTVVIMATAIADTSIVIRCMKQGAYDYLIKPFSLDEVVLNINAALLKRELELGDRNSHRLPEDTVASSSRVKVSVTGNKYAAELLKLMVDKGASDMHLMPSSPPVLRIDGTLVRQEDLPPNTAEGIEVILASITTPEQRDTFLKDLELDFVYGVPRLARFRANALRQMGTTSLAFRLVPNEVLSIDKLGLPQICREFVRKPRGLILVTGPTGSGKSTTLAAMVDYINETETRSIITIEAPIEFVHRNKRSIIVQRDLGKDTKSFSIALVHALRHDPDIIVIGEMRDMDTISVAITAAETGHLVLSTLHTTDAAQTIDRIIDVYPPAQQPQIRLQLSQVLEMVLSQALLSKAGGKGRVAAFEIMIANPAIRNLLREGKSYELPNVMQLNRASGMQTMDQSLAELVKKHLVTLEEAMTKSSHPEQLQRLLQY